MDISPEARRKLRDVIWAAGRYEPTEGYFPVYNLEGELVIESRGQREIHENRSRIKMVAGGVRAGKSKFTAMDTAEDLLVENGLMWIVGPDYEQCKAEFRYLYEALETLGFVEGRASMPEKGSQNLTTTWGFRIQTKSGADLMALASFSCNIILIVEANQQDGEVYSKAIERTVETNGRILISGTLEKSAPWYAEKWTQWQGENEAGARSFSIPTWSNTVIFPGGRTDPKILAMEDALNDPALFMERCAAIPAKPTGLVFGQFEPRRHVKKLEFNPKLEAQLAIDPAKHTYAIELIQFETLPIVRWLERLEKDPGKFSADILSQERTMVYVVDEVYRHGLIIQDILPAVKAKPWYPYIKRGVIDVAGKQEQGNKSQIQIWAEETSISLASKYVFIPEGIAQVRLRLRNDPILGVPLIQFAASLDVTKNEQGKPNGIVPEFGVYKWPNVKEGNAESVLPVDFGNDGLKALSYWCYDRFGPVLERKKLPRSRIRRYA